MAWYAMHVSTGMEDSVCERIRQQVDLVHYSADYKLLVPKHKLPEKRDGVYVEVLRTMFPGYVLVESDEVREFAEGTLKAKGIFRFLQTDGAFQKIRPTEIMAVLELVDEQGLINSSAVEIEDGVVRVVSGPLKGHEGWIRKVDKYRRRAKVELWLDGRNYFVDLSIEVDLNRRNYYVGMC